MYIDYNSLIEQHREGVALLFSEYGINAPINAITLASAVHKYGDDFGEDLEDIIELDFVGFKDKATRKAGREAKKQARKEKKGTKKPFGETKFGSWLKGNSSGILSGVVGAVGSGILGGKKQDSTTIDNGGGGAGTGKKDDDPLTDEEKADKKKKEQNLIYMAIAGVVIVGLLIAVVLMPSKVKGV